MKKWPIIISIIRKIEIISWWIAYIDPYTPKSLTEMKKEDFENKEKLCCLMYICHLITDFTSVTGYVSTIWSFGKVKLWNKNTD